jgi:hypothetical protein
MWVRRPCRELMVPQLSVVEEVEGGVCDVPVLWGLVGAKIAFAAMDPPQWVTGAVKSWEFESLDVFGDSALPSSECDLLHLCCLNAGLEWPQELHHGIDAPCQIGERDLLLSYPDTGAGMHGGRRIVVV